jgi:hypothetical protein
MRTTVAIRIDRRDAIDTDDDGILLGGPVVFTSHGR